MRLNRALPKAVGARAHRRMAKAETWRAAHRILERQIKVTWLALIAALAFDVRLADAGAVARPTRRRCVENAGAIAVAWPKRLIVWAFANS